MSVPEAGDSAETVFSPLIRWSQNQVSLQVGSFGVFSALSVLCASIGAPWVWDTIHQVVTEFRDDLFSDQGEDYHLHRVTLFQYKRWCWRRPLWPLHGPHLVAVARSHHRTQRAIAVFKASDRHTEGVAGIAWSRPGWVRIPSSEEPLPILKKTSNPQEKQAYTEQTGVSLKWVNKKLQSDRPIAASYAALCILCRGKPWGVLVIDSAMEFAHESDRLTTAYRPVARILQPLLERVSRKGG